MPNVYPLDSSTSVSIGGYSFWDEGGTEDLATTNPSATRNLLCNWEDRQGFLATLGGGYDPIQGVYNAPLPHPAYNYLWPTRARISQVFGPDGFRNDTINGQPYAGAQWARLLVTYTRQQFDPSIITVGEITVDTSVEYTIPSRIKPTLQWADGTPLPAADTPGIPVSVATMTLKRNNCQYIPSNLRLLEGCVNAANFAGGAPETVKFDRMVSQKTITLGGVNNWDLTFLFSYKSVGWNTVWRPDQSSYQPVTTIPASSSPMVPAPNAAIGAGFNISTGQFDISAWVLTAPPLSLPNVAAGGKKIFPPADFSVFSGYM